ncbi:MAG: hypothetical protein ACOYMA_11320 [Bacteroidia bacterium]
MAGMFFAYVGAFIRWLIGGRKNSIKYYFTEEGNNDFETAFGSSILNRMIGLITTIVLMFLLGSFL